MTIELNMLQTMATGILALLLGRWLNKSFSLLRRICIPAPVTGGLVFSFLTLMLNCCFKLEIGFDGTLKDICMVVFFTSVGLQSNLKVLKKGGRPLIVMVILVGVLIVFQNLIGVGMAHGLGIDPLLGMAAGSVTMCGGHGTAAGFSPLFESMGLASATTVTMATATFGLLGGSLIGGPVAEFLVRRRKLAERGEGKSSAEFNALGEEKLTNRGYTIAAYIIFLCAGLGTLLNKLLALTGMTFPTYFGALIVAVIVRNCSESIPGLPLVPMPEVNSIGNVSLSFFLGMAMISLRLWELSGIALPLLVILGVQLLFIATYAMFVAFPLLGKDYDAAVLVSGLCGFGLGATPNAMANMSAVCGEYRYSATPFFIIPIVGAMFVDIINIFVTTAFLNFI